jgi:hypothetical protein
MPVSFPYGFILATPEPIDSRIVTANHKATIPQLAYNGLVVYNTTDKKLYKLIDYTKVTQDAGWKEVLDVDSVPTLTKTVAGASASLILSSSGDVTASLQDGLVWIVTSPTANSGETFIWSTPNKQWYFIPKLDTTAGDARYLKLAGGTMTGNITIDSGYKVNGTSSWADSASVATIAAGVNGGQQFYIPYWKSSNSALTSSIIYQSNDNNIGIGTSSPSYKLDVSGSFRQDGGVFYKKYYTNTDNQTFKMGSGYELYNIAHDDGGYEYYITNNTNFGSAWIMNIGSNTNKIISISSNNVAFSQSVTFKSGWIHDGNQQQTYLSSSNVGMKYLDNAAWNYVIVGQDNTPKLRIADSSYQHKVYISGSAYVAKYTSETDRFLDIADGSIVLGINSGNRYIKSNVNAIGIQIGSTTYGLIDTNFKYDGIKVTSENTVRDRITLTGSAQTLIGSFGSEIGFTPQVNDRDTNNIIRAYDGAYDATSGPTSHIYMYAGKNTTSNTYGNIILQYDGTNTRGNVGIGTSSPSASLDISASVAKPNALRISGIVGNGEYRNLISITGSNLVGPDQGPIFDISALDQTTTLSLRGTGDSPTLKLTSGCQTGAGIENTCGYGSLYFKTQYTTYISQSSYHSSTEDVPILVVADELGRQRLKVDRNFGTAISFGGAGYALTVTGSTFLSGSTFISGSTTITGNIYISASNNTTSVLTVQGSGSANPIFSVSGSQGDLFSVTDSLSGSLFSVNDSNGLPIIEAFSDGTATIGSQTKPAIYTSVETVINTGIGQIIYQMPTASSWGTFYDYTIKSGSTGRVGNIMAMWSGSSVNFTEVSASSFGTTTGFKFGVIVTGSYMALTGSATTDGWIIRTIIRSI